MGSAGWLLHLLNTLTVSTPMCMVYFSFGPFFLRSLLNLLQLLLSYSGFPGGLEVKASACNAGDLGSIPGLGRSSGEGNGNPLQYSCLENPMVFSHEVCWIPTPGPGMESTSPTLEGEVLPLDHQGSLSYLFWKALFILTTQKAFS